MSMKSIKENECRTALGEQQILNVPCVMFRTCLGQAFRWDHLALLLQSGHGKGKSICDHFQDTETEGLSDYWGTLSATFHSSFQRTSFLLLFHYFHLLGLSILRVCVCLSVCLCLFFFYFLRLSTWFIHFWFILLLIAYKAAYISL